MLCNDLGGGYGTTVVKGSAPQTAQQQQARAYAAAAYSSGKTKRVGIIGARGYVGRELVKLIGM